MLAAQPTRRTMSEQAYDVMIVGAGVAGLSASIFTARHDLNTIVADGGDPLLRRNAHLENFPGFPAGVNSRLLLDMMRDQATRAGAEFVQARVTDLQQTNGGFVAETDAADTYHVDYVIAATKNTTDFLPSDVEIVDHGKEFVSVDRRGRTDVEGLYAAGRLAEEPHQTVISAGHGAKAAVTLIEDSDRPFYHDWVAPDRYFTGRGRDVPPGCEEINEDERQRREQESLKLMREYFTEAHPDRPQQHPSVVAADDD